MNFIKKEIKKKSGSIKRIIKKQDNLEVLNQLPLR